MAEVYRAKQLTAFGREVAIKVIRAGFSEDASFRERFLREAQAISKLSHPNILPLIEFGEQDRHSISSCRWPAKAPCVICSSSATARCRWRKPCPCLYNYVALCSMPMKKASSIETSSRRTCCSSSARMCCLADFGIARDTTETQMTATGAGIGTVEYMAPEQAIGQADQAQRHL